MNAAALGWWRCIHVLHSCPLKLKCLRVWLVWNSSCSCFTWLSACLKLCLLYSLVPARCPGRWTSSCESLGTPECSFVLLAVRVTFVECPEVVPRNQTRNVLLSAVLFALASRGRLNGSELKALPSCCCLLCLCPQALQFFPVPFSTECTFMRGLGVFAQTDAADRCLDPS